MMGNAPFTRGGPAPRLAASFQGDRVSDKAPHPPVPMPLILPQDHKWYNFNDSHASSDSAPTGSSTSAYVLIYRRRGH